MAEFRILTGNVVGQLAAFEPESFDACLCDPPYGLEFMGKEWDKLAVPRVGNLGGFADGSKPSFARAKRYLPAMQDWHRQWAEAVYRVLKPGAFLLAFGGTRTFHRLTCGLEDAGFEIRDCIGYAWVYGSGFPKSRQFGCRCVRRVRQEIAEDAAKPATEVLFSDLQQFGSYEPAGAELRCVRPELDRQDEGAGSAEQDVLSAVRQGTHAEAAGETGAAELEVSNLRHSLPSRTESKAKATQASLLGVQRGGESTHSTGEETAQKFDARTGESVVEGRGDLQASEGELHRPALREMPTGVPVDGKTGRLRDGAPPGDGAPTCPPARALGSRTPSESQPTRQPTGESGAVRVELGAQEGRGLCPTCGGVIGFEGYGTSLKPAFEPVTVAMKPLAGTFAANALVHGVAGINVDGCRVAWRGMDDAAAAAAAVGFATSMKRGSIAEPSSLPTKYDKPEYLPDQLAGRWPANLVLSHLPECEEVGTREIRTDSHYPAVRGSGGLGTSGHAGQEGLVERGGEESVVVFRCAPGCPVAMLDAQSGERQAGGNLVGTEPSRPFDNCYGEMKGRRPWNSYADRGGASRFFYCAKVDTAERNSGGTDNRHPTLKPIDLTAYLARLLLPPQRDTPRRLLVPFAGTGSEMIGALRAGWDEVVGIEREADYAEIARRRVTADAPILHSDIAPPSAALPAPSEAR